MKTLQYCRLALPTDITSNEVTYSLSRASLLSFFLLSNSCISLHRE